MFHEGVLGFPKSLHLFENSIVKPIVFFFQEEIMKVLFICTGNICRSPMGELLLPQFMPDLESDSAGTRGLVAHEIAPNSKRLLDQHGIDSSSFRAKRVTPQIAQGSDLILCFEHEQRKEIAVIAPTADPQNLPHQRFRQHVRLLQGTGVHGGNTRQEKLESVIDNASMIRPMIPDTNNVEDPIGKDFAVYQAATRNTARLCRP